MLSKVSDLGLWPFEVHPSCKRSRKFRVGWVDGSIHFISKECIISPKFLQKALVWLSKFDGEFLQNSLSNFDGRLR